MYKNNIKKYYAFRVLYTINLTVPIFMLFMLDIGLTGFQIFITQAIYAGIELLLTVPSGIFADKVGRKFTLIVSSLTYAAGYLLYGVAEGFWGIIIAEVVFAISSASFHGTGEAFLFDTLAEEGKEKKFKKVVGTAFAIQSTIIGISAIVGGWIASIDLALPFFISAVPAGLSVLPLLFLHEPKRVKAEKQEFKKAIIEALSDKELRHLLYYMGISTLAGFAGFMLYQPLLTAAGIPVQGMGLFVFALGIATAIGNKLSHKVEKHIAGKNFLLLFTTMKAVLYLVMYLFGSWTLMVCAFMLDMVGGFASPIVVEMLSKKSRKETRATINSVGSMAATLSFTMLSPVVGKTVDLFSEQAGILLIALLFAGLGLKFVFRKQ